MKYTFEECLAYMEITLGCRLLDWQKEMLQNIYDGKEYFYMPPRHYEKKIALKAIELFEELINKENM